MEMGSPFTAGRIPVIIRGEKTILGKGVLYMADRCRIRTEFPRPERGLVESFRGVPAANIADSLDRSGSLGAPLAPLNASPLLGVAFTVRCAPGDNLMFHRALDLARPGDVLVVSAGGDMSRALCGELMAGYARSRGLAGFVIDGCVRDRAALAALTDFPVYARGFVPDGPDRSGPGEINFPVTVGRQVIRPGDILAGDGDGVVVIRPEEAREAAARAAALGRRDEKRLADILAGRGFPHPFVEEALEKLGVEYAEGE